MKIKTLLNLVLKNEFNKQMRSIDHSSPEIDIIQKDMIDNIDAKKEIKSDLVKIKLAEKAVKKISSNETPLKKEFTAYSDLRHQYPEHLEEDSETESESDSYNNSTKQNDTDKLKELNTYLKGEYKSASSSLKLLKKSFYKLSFSTEKDTIKRKTEESTNIDSSKRIRPLEQDPLRDIPLDYNPLDDIGTD